MKTVVLLNDYEAYLALACSFCTVPVVNPAFSIFTGVIELLYS